MNSEFSKSDDSGDMIRQLLTEGGAAWDPSQVRYKRVGSRSTWAGYGQPNAVEYYYSPLMPEYFVGAPPQKAPKAVVVRDS